MNTFASNRIIDLKIANLLCLTCCRYVPYIICVQYGSIFKCIDINYISHKQRRPNISLLQSIHRPRGACTEFLENLGEERDASPIVVGATNGNIPRSSWWCMPFQSSMWCGWYFKYSQRNWKKYSLGLPYSWSPCPNFHVNSILDPYCTEAEKMACTWFGEICYCCS